MERVFERLPGRLGQFARSDTGQKLWKYSAASVVAVAVGQVVLIVTVAVRLWTPGWDNVLAVVAGGLPSYYLNRNWAWGKSGKSHMWREVVPFWVLAFLGLLISTWAVAVTAHYAKSHHYHHAVVVIAVALANILSFGVLWVVKFILFNKVMFVHHPQDLPEALDGRTGIPT